MSKFIDNFFSEVQGQFAQKTNGLAMGVSYQEIDNLFPTLIAWKFKAVWEMNANGKAEDYKTIHKIMLQKLRREIYSDFWNLLDDLSFAAYERDYDKVQNVIVKIKEEINGNV